MAISDGCVLDVFSREEQQDFLGRLEAGCREREAGDGCKVSVLGNHRISIAIC